MPVIAAKPAPAGGHGAGGHSGARGAPSPSPSHSTERIYSAKQLAEALKSGLAAVKDQLQVLAILDGTAMSWPGVSQAIDDLDFLTDMSLQTTSKLENTASQLRSQLDESQAEASTLKESLASALRVREDLQRDLSMANKDLKSTRSQLDAANKELQSQRQECWQLEKQRADLASDLDKCKQDIEFMEGEISSLRSTASEQQEATTRLKEDLASKRSDANHLSALVQELKATNAHLKQQLGAAQVALAGSQAQLQSERADKNHYEREAERLAEEASRLGAELDRASREVTRMREWQDIIKKVEADKLREAQDAHTKSRLEAESRVAEEEKRAAQLRTEVAASNERLAGREAELDSCKASVALLQLQVKDLQKQLSLCQGEKAAMAKTRDEQRAAAAKLQAQINQMKLDAERASKDVAVSEGKTKEVLAKERALMQAKLDDALKEAAVSRALADSWQRDLKQAAAKVQAESQRASALHAQLEAAKSAAASSQLEVVRSTATVEQQLVVLKAQLASKDDEIRRTKYDAMSSQKQLEKTIERLQREVDASAAEIERLSGGHLGHQADGTLFQKRLPPVGRAPTIQEDLEALRRAIRNGSSGSPMKALSIVPPATASGALPLLNSPTAKQSDGSRSAKSDRGHLHQRHQTR